MPRTTPEYIPKDKRKRWKEEDMEKAITIVREKKMGTQKAAKTFNVPRTTLQTLSKKLDFTLAQAARVKLGRKPYLASTSGIAPTRRKRPSKRDRLSSASEDDFALLDPPLDDGDSDLEILEGGYPGDENASCMFCERLFSEDSKEKLWVMCFQCNRWAHSDCVGAEKDVYICDFCK